MIVLGLVAILFSLLADTIGIGQEPRFGWKQGMVLAGGLTLLLAGLVRRRVQDQEPRAGQPRHHPMVVGLATLGVMAFGVLTLVTSKQALAPILLFDGPSYVELAQHIRAHWFRPPPSLNLRPPLYPTVIAVAGWLSSSDGLAVVVNLQVLAWVLVGALVSLWVY